MSRKGAMQENAEAPHSVLSLLEYSLSSVCCSTLPKASKDLWQIAETGGDIVDAIAAAADIDLRHS